MQALRRGDTGPAVRALQRKLQQAGFSPGLIDGEFGGGTEAAVLAFQRSAGLLADGIVGKDTAAALGLSRRAAPIEDGKMPEISTEMAARMFPGAPLGNIKTHLPRVLAALEAAGLTAAPLVLCALATIRAETAGFVPIDEGISRFNTSPQGHPFDLYDNRADLGNRGEPDGASFKGRGFIQLTGRSNYERFGPLIGVPDLALRPERANEPDIAAALLAAFIKAKERIIREALLEDDLRAARRAVNGGSHGLESFTQAYRTGQSLLGLA
jgi:peptidoglycan L-alanyl-D-glutamate endopeptidase CwlK